MHRDSAGAHNIARIGMAQLLQQPRPASLRRPTQVQPAAQAEEEDEGDFAQAEEEDEGDFGFD